MALEIKLSQKLSQSLVMTPQLQQAIKLLQLGRVEYLEVIEKELLENPILEDAREEERTRVSTEDSPKFQSGDSSNEGNESNGDGERTRQGDDPEWANYLDLYADSYSSSFGPARRGDFDDDRPSLEATVGNPEGLSSHLMWQLRTSELTSEEREIAMVIIGNLDRNGLLLATVEEIAEDTKSDPAVVEAVLFVVQTFDPIGVAARDLQECLLIQLDHAGLRDTLTGRIVQRHLSKLENRKYDQIAREEHVPVEEVYEAIKRIQKLEPRPGRPFADETPVYITPDIYVKKVGDDWVISLNEAGMPKLRLNPRYRELLDAGKTAKGEEKEYLQEKLRGAAWLIKSIHQRQQTIYKVAESIMKFQREFLDFGTPAMKPLVLRDVAEDVKMHESTVSRVTTAKYIHTPHGVFELKYFFSSGLQTSDGEISSESVKEKIRDLVAGEDTASPLSDQAIVEKLKADGIDIARRTVAKYREMMNILSSSRRRKVF